MEGVGAESGLELSAEMCTGESGWLWKPNNGLYSSQPLCLLTCKMGGGMGGQGSSSLKVFPSTWSLVLFDREALLLQESKCLQPS